MKLLFISLFLFLFDAFEAESNLKPEQLFILRKQEPGDDLAQVYSNQSPSDGLQSPPKAIVINSVSDQMAKEQQHHITQAVVNAVQSQFNKDIANRVIKEPDYNDPNILNILFSEPVREVNDQQSNQQKAHKLPQQPQMRQQFQQESLLRSTPQAVQRIYKLPILTRTISKEETEPTYSARDIKTVENPIPMWRSPIPFMHNNCKHSMSHEKLYPKKLRSYRDKGRKHHKSSLSLLRYIESEQNPTFMRPFLEINNTEPTAESEFPVSPLKTLFMSLISRLPDSEPEALESLDNKIKPSSAFIMAITRKIEPELELPLRPDIKLKSQIPTSIKALLRKKQDRPEQKLSTPFNPFLGLLSKMIQKPSLSKGSSNFISGNVPIHEAKIEKPITNYNFNINFTVNNNNYIKKEISPFLESLLLFPIFRSL